MKELTEKESIDLRVTSRCPCGGRLLKGPCGGMANNMKCDVCGTIYCVPIAPFLIQIME